MWKLALVATAILLSGCSHPLTLFARGGGVSGSGEANEIGKKVTINIGTKVYTGTYVYDGGAVIVGSSYGTATAFYGARSAMAYGSTSSTTYVPGSGNGKVLATSSSGDSIRCDFMYSSGTGIGYCQDSAGQEYDLLIK